MFKLIIDNREKYVIRHTDILGKVINTQAQLTVGDYVITYRDNETAPERVFAVFERKTLEDYAASMKDGRSDNKNKLLQLRDETHCKIFYIIEGPAFPTPGATFARTPYCYIQSSIFHLQIEYDIQVIQTRDTLHTAETLVAFVRSMENLAKSRGAVFKTFHLTNTVETTDIKDITDIKNIKDITDIKNTTGSGDCVANSADPIALLTAARPRNDNEILRSMWACFRYITVETASEFMYSFSLSDIFRGVVTKDTLEAFKTSTGRKLKAHIIGSLLRSDSHRNARILACIPGISESRAKDILKQHSLRQLLSYSAGAISIIKVGISRKNLGETAAENILKYFTMKPEILGTPRDVSNSTPNNLPNDAPKDAPNETPNNNNVVLPAAQDTDVKLRAPRKKALPQEKPPKPLPKTRAKKINAVMSDEIV